MAQFWGLAAGMLWRDVQSNPRPWDTDMEKEEIRQAIKAIPKDAWTRLPTHWTAATEDMTIRLQAAGGHLNNCEDLVALVQAKGQMAIFQWKRGDIL